LRDLIEYMERDPRTVTVQGVNLLKDGRVHDSGLLLTTFFTATFRCRGLPVGKCPEKVSYVSSIISCLALYNVRVVLSKRGLCSAVTP